MMVKGSPDRLDNSVILHINIELLLSYAITLRILFTHLLILADIVHKETSLF